MCKRLRHTNARYGGAGQQPPTPLSKARAQTWGAAERPSRPRQHMYRSLASHFVLFQFGMGSAIASHDLLCGYVLAQSL
eukprot:6195457-Pleurochrysis_carterae.AAC.1